MYFGDFCNGNGMINLKRQCQEILIKTKNLRDLFCLFIMGQTERFYLKGCRKISQGCPINISNCYPWDLRSNNFCFAKDSELSICMSLILNKHTVVQISFLCSWLKLLACSQHPVYVALSLPQSLCCLSPSAGALSLLKNFFLQRKDDM